ncbi:MAG TPA: SPOR domain-containing protein [Terracidiphilus sp.]|jgi:cell division septation protein DedD
MRGAFDDLELEPVQARRDTELTLGSGTLLVIFGGLVLLCGLCFGLGYMLGHHGSQSPTAAAPAAETASQPLGAGSSLAKPSATETAAQPSPEADGAASDPSAPVASSLTPAAEAQTLPVPVAAGAPNQPEVHPALTPAVETNQPGQAGIPVHPAFVSAPAAPAGSLMVQIAAVSNTEDAEVLTSALRKRGYTVNARREPADNLVHVRVGPFATPAEANSWKMKLLNDGYNAVVQQ